MDGDIYVLDDIDRQILRELRKDGRASYRVIADNLNIADGTVRARVSRMTDLGILKISPLVNPFYFKNSILAHIGMQLESRTHHETMRKIAELEGVLSVCNSAGEFDLMVEVYLHSRDELNHFLFGLLPKIEGIKSTHTFVYLDARNKWIEPKF
ncbi:MAG: Lrp/AsnC family transcriptional regulator [Spirochaetales bacterium]|nr:Lrp/AsnC family transcriptional regulator [Spirochaetales bacterium]